MASPALTYKRDLLTLISAGIFEGAYLIVYKVPKKFFRLLIVILKRKLNSWNLPYIILNYFIIIVINAKYSYYIANNALRQV